MLTYSEKQRQRYMSLQSQQSAPSSLQPSQPHASLQACAEKHQQHTQQSNETSTHGSQDIAGEGVGYLTAEQYFSMNLNAGWQKLEGYYKRLDDNGVYVAAVVLHP
jgi:hypothetical protein